MTPGPGAVPRAVSDLVNAVLAQATAATRPMRPDLADALRWHLAAAIGPLLAQLAAENARLLAELRVRDATTGYVADLAQQTAAAEEEARRWERRWAGAVAQARAEHRRATAAEHHATGATP